MNLSDKIKEQVGIKDLAERCGYPVTRNGFCYSIYKQEKTPSLKLYPGSNTFFDYSCAQGGSVIDFWMGVYNLEFKDAVEELARVFGIDRDRENFVRNVPVKAVRTRSENIFECMSDDELYLYQERAGIAGEKQAFKEVRRYRIAHNEMIYRELYNYCMQRSFGYELRQYLTVSRQLTVDIIKRFKLFFIRNYFEVNNHLKKIFSIKDLQRSGLYNVKENGTGNLLFAMHRIIIPYLHKGEIVYLRGRYFDQDNSTDPGSSSKYLGLRNDALNVNSPKRFFNRDVIATLEPGEKVYLVEGEFDAMVLEGLGYNAIALPGTGSLPGEKEFMALTNFEVVLCPDGDEAGKILEDKVLSIFWKMGKEIKVKKLPSKDVTEFVKAVG